MGCKFFFFSFGLHCLANPVQDVTKPDESNDRDDEEEEEYKDIRRH